MRRMIFASLALLPVTAAAYAANPSDPNPSSPPPNVSAVLKTSATAAAITAVSTQSMIHEFVFTEVKGVVLKDAADVGSRDYSYQSGAPKVTEAPAIARMVNTNVTLDDLATRPAVSNVTVHATVDEYGVPQNLAITRSAGDTLDGKVLAAVAQYRFRPATVDHRPVQASVMILVKIARP